MKGTQFTFIVVAAALVLGGCDLFKGSQKVSLPENPIVNGQANSTVQSPSTEQPATTPQPPAQEQVTYTQQPATTEPAASTKQPPPQPPAPATMPAAPTQPASGEVAQNSMKSRFSGSVATRSRAALAFKVSGFIEKIYVQTGQSCLKGDVLAKLDPRDYKINRDMAQAQLNLARVALTNATREFDRENALYKQKASTDSSFDRLTAGLDKAKIDVQMAELRLQQTTEALDDTSLKAPYDCVVTKQLKNEHENVQVGSPVLEIYNIADLEFQFSVPENLAGKIKIGDKMDVIIPATGFTGKLEVSRLVPVITDISRTFLIVVRAPLNDSRVVGGLYAEAVMP